MLYTSGRLFRIPSHNYLRLLEFTTVISLVALFFLVSEQPVLRASHPLLWSRTELATS